MKIAHISDTHLGRRFRSTRNGIINQEVRPLEDDFYNSWIKIVDEIIYSKNKPDLILHSGDFFDTPAGYDPSSPPEFARKVASDTFKKLLDAKIPIVIIDGNHGRYMEYRTSTISEYVASFENVSIFTHYNARDSIRDQKALFKDFNDLDLRIIAHPSIESKALSIVGKEIIYKKWIDIQNNSVKETSINVGIAHGMTLNSSLDPNFLVGNYHYIALGDDHHRKKISENTWYAGSTQYWNFDESKQEKGYLIVEVEKNKSYPKVFSKNIDIKRRMVNEEIRIDPKDTNSTIIKRIIDRLDENGLNIPYYYPSAARVKINVRGKRKHGSQYNLAEIETSLRQLTLNTNEYNVVEFLFTVPEYDNFNKSKNNFQYDTNFEYLLEDPHEEFKDYMTSFRKDHLKKNGLDPNKLSSFFAEALMENKK